ncbi:TolC family protein [Gammaproteobacteria bacterium]
MMNPITEFTTGKTMNAPSKPRIKPLTLLMAFATPMLFSNMVPALSLQEATGLAIKNSPTIMTEGINVKLKGADMDIAYKFFDPKLEAEYMKTSLGGFEYPDELEKMSLASLGPNTNSQTSFLPDNVRTDDLKLSLKKMFLNGLYTELAINLTQRNSEREKLAGSDAIDALNNGGMKRSINDYFPFTYGVMKFVTRVPLWGRGDLAEGIGDYESKKLKYDAAIANMNHAISSILASAVYAYWDNRAAAAKYQLRKDSLVRAERWYTHIIEIINKMKNAEAIKTQSSELNRIEGYVQEKRKDMNNAETELSQSRSALANALGLSMDKATTMGDANDPLPQVEINHKLIDPNEWNKMALTNRLDIQSLKLEDQAADELLKWMKDYDKPELNLVLAVHQQMVDFGKDRLVNNYIDTIENTSGKLGYTVGLQYTQVLGKTAAKGRITQATLNKMKNQIALNNTIRKTNIDLKALAEKVSSTISTAESAAQSAHAYQRSVNAAVADKSQTFATAFRQFDTERDWINGEADLINAQATLAKVIVEVRHQTATLIQQTNDSSQIKLQDIITLPGN